MNLLNAHEKSFEEYFAANIVSLTLLSLNQATRPIDYKIFFMPNIPATLIDVLFSHVKLNEKLS